MFAAGSPNSVVCPKHFSEYRKQHDYRNRAVPYLFRSIGGKGTGADARDFLYTFQNTGDIIDSIGSRPKLIIHFRCFFLHIHTVGS